MKYFLALLLLASTQAHATSCTVFGNHTRCSNGVSVYQLGNMTKIQVPGQPDMRVYNSNPNKNPQIIPVIPVKRP